MKIGTIKILWGSKMRFSKIGLTLCLLAAALVSAKTGRIALDSADDFSAGKIKGASVSSLGRVVAGREVKEIDVDANMVWSLLELGPDRVLVGTGNKPRLFEYAGGKLTQLFQDEDKGRLAVTDIARAGSGDIYFSVIPKPAVYRMQGKEVKKLAEPQVSYIWTLLALEKGGVLAGGGPRASVFYIKPDGKVEKILSLDAEHVMEIIDAGNGEFLAGTSKPGMVVKFSLDGKYSVVQSFQEEEVSSLRKLANGSLIVAVNQGGAMPMPSQMPTIIQEQPGQAATPKPGMKEPMDQDMDQLEQEMLMAQLAPKPPAAGKTSVYLINPGKGIKQLLALKHGTIMALFGNEKSGFFLGTDDQGKVFQIFPDRDEYLLGFDLTGSRVIAFAGEGGELHFIGTGQPAKLVKVEKGAAKSEWQSNSLDAQNPAKWGVLGWQGRGVINFETRTGNLSEPGNSWSKWQELGPGNPAEIKSPVGRYLQVRARFIGADDEVSRIEVSYRDINQAQYIRELSVNSGSGPATPKPPMMEQPGAPKNSRTGADAMKRCAINWRIDNPDQDQLYQELYYKRSDEKLWTLIQKGEQLKGSNFQFDANDLPDGLYRVKLVVSDWPDNPEAEAFRAEKISEQFLIDTTKPELSFTVSASGKVSGEARDATSAITQMEYFVDDGDGRPVLSEDGVLDQREEKFEFTAKDVKAGPHKITVQACDQADNCRTRSEEFEAN
jgi:hypothetical protein